MLSQCTFLNPQKIEESGSVEDRPCSGHPQLSSAREDREFVRISLRKRRLTSTQLKREWNETSLVSCSSRTVRRRLDDHGLYGRVAIIDRHIYNNPIKYGKRAQRLEC